MWDMGDTATLFQDAAGATPVTAVTQPIGRVNDKSGLGNHATQPTAGSRPLFSARKNLLTKTEDLTVAPWSAAGATVTNTVISTPLGTVTAARLVSTSAASDVLVSQVASAPGKVGSCSVMVQRDNNDWIALSNNSWFAYFNTATGTIGSVGGGTLTATSYGSNTYLLKWENQGAGDYGTLRLRVASADGVATGNAIGQGAYFWFPQSEFGPIATQYQRVNTAIDYDTIGFPAFAQFDAVDDALLFPAITFGGAFNTFVAGKVTGGTQGVHLWRTADVNGTWAKYKSGDATTPTGTGSGSPTYAVNGTALSPSQQGQLYAQINGVDCVVESIGVVLTAETALQLSGFVGSLFTGNAHRVLMISGTLTAGEKLLCRQWCAQGNGVTVV